MRYFAWLAGCAMVGSALAQGLPDAQLPPTLHTKLQAFSIPFRVEQGQSAPQEVQLHVSEDQGRTWKLIARQAPTARGFAYRTDHDGEYWFSVQSMATAGETAPPRDSRPELRVIVDTEVPRLELAAQPDGNGAVKVRWQAGDVNLKPQTLKIEYRTSASEEWRDVQAAVPPLNSAQISQRGEVTIWPPAGSAHLEVRAVVHDEAQNVGTAQTQLALSEQPAANANIAGQGSAEHNAPAVTPPGPVRPSLADALRQASQRQTQLPQTNVPLAHPGPNVPPNANSGGQWRPDVTTNAPLGSAESAVGAPANMSPPANTHYGPRYAHNRYTPPANPTQQSPPLDSNGGWRSANPAEMTAIQRNQSQPNGSTGAVNPVADRVRPPVGAQVARPRGSQPQVPLQPAYHPPAANSSAPPARSPADIPVQRINARRFELPYQVDTLQGAGIAKVELWGTIDDGQTWNLYGVDDDNLSPMVVTVPGESMYGFRIVVHAVGGRGGQPPQAGEQPDVWISVDLTRPSSRLYGVEREGAPESNVWTVRWEASDERLADRPISLFYGPQPGGPWTAVVTGLDNTGRFLWQADENTPDSVYVRLEARDAAGNVGIYVTPEATQLRMPAPRGRILGVRPLN